MANILFVATVYRTGEKIYPIIKDLSRDHKVDVLLLYQMSRQTSWMGDFDMRKLFYNNCKNLKIYDGPSFGSNTDENGAAYEKFFSKLDNTLPIKHYNLAIVDNNITVHGGHMSMFYEWCQKQGVTVVSAPHGNRDFKGYRVSSRFGRHFDYSFVFGPKERNGLISEDGSKKYRRRYLSGGIPANDGLKNLTWKKEYILIVPSITDPKQILGPVKHFRPFTKEEFDRLGILEVAEKIHKPIIIKEKNKQKYNSSFLRDSLRNYPVDFILDAIDDNELIANACCVISAPSTMAFKPIQMGIPTVILNGHGMLGNFFDYPGLTECDKKSFHKQFYKQIESGKHCDFIENTLTGGLDFSSTKIYVDIINDMLRR